MNDKQFGTLESVDQKWATAMDDLCRSQHAAIERKDALLRQALEIIDIGLGSEGGAYGALHNDATDLTSEIKQELSQ